MGDIPDATTPSSPRSMIHTDLREVKFYEAAESEGGAVSIIGDDLRAYHPAYARLLEEDDGTAALFTDADSGAWVEKSIERAVKAEVSWQGVLERYHAQKASRGAGRMTTEEAHQAAYDGLMPTVAALEEGALADVLSLHRRGGSLLYQNTSVNGRWSKPMGACDAIARERRRRPTAQEILELLKGYERLRGHLKRSTDPGGETAAFIERQRALAAAKLDSLQARGGKVRASTAGKSGPGL